MEGMELASFQIISSVGAARSCIIEAMKLGRQRKFTEAYKKIDEANEFLSEGHKKSCAANSKRGRWWRRTNFYPLHARGRSIYDNIYITRCSL